MTTKNEEKDSLEETQEEELARVKWYLERNLIYDAEKPLLGYQNGIQS